MDNKINLFDAILGTVIDQPEMRFNFYQAFLELELIVLGRTANIGPSQDDEGPSLFLKYIEIENELVLPVYSSLKKFLTIFPSNQHYVQIHSRDLLPLIDADASIVLNPGFDLSKKMIPEELLTLRDGRILPYFFEQLSETQKEKFLVSQVMDVPFSTLQLMSSCVRTVPAIKKAYFTNMYNPIFGGTTFPLVCLELDVLERESSGEILSHVFTTINNNLNIHQRIESAVLDDSLPLTASIVKNIEPFYVRLDELKELFR
ncbi:enhanced serine sensitivity protein SseB C-terminal domain-containing protein [Neobacillus cucumis]|uniref:SseB family protein n=1 Tax=Neobacillus cucumis TaxID=1740721 RepID=UPI0018DFBA7C|nr:enhanced serine sensitivity protein SseB C-terminal domain-containing protein [Neobacillus cucumis]MBI0578661.1 enhanced serine sensitivity protein SseB C-terminal domain-containing protein [Neobacillus cucumis]